MRSIFRGLSIFGNYGEMKRFKRYQPPNINEVSYYDVEKDGLNRNSH
ncbi:hypothetical protein AAG747_18765 [Rapidithrix thailandica]|uniref:Uncharacterized protein n=1 Tax=Rapidithrix thailandica TaxID=413964 RepID=A0AAW9SBV7_9BACT